MVVSRPVNWALVLFGYGILLTSSFVDNSRPPAIPKLMEVFHLSYQTSSWVFSLGYIAAILANYSLIPLTSRFPIGRVIKGYFAFTVVVLVSSFWIANTESLFLFSFAVGMAIAALGSLCNIVVIHAAGPAYRTRLLCGLHCMYGLGSFLAPSAAKALYGRGFAWFSPLIIPTVASALFLLIPLNLGEEDKQSDPKSPKLNVGILEILSIFAFATYVTGEVLISSWMPSYLTHQGLELGRANTYLSYFFLMMGATRIICFVGLRPALERVILLLSLLLSTLFFITGRIGWPMGFALSGILGPFFPGFVGRISFRFQEKMVPLMLLIFTVNQIFLSGSQWLFGQLAGRVGVETAYNMPLYFIGTACVMLFGYFVLENRQATRRLAAA